MGSLGVTGIFPMEWSAKMKIYMAGPDVFHPQAREIGAVFRTWGRDNNVDTLYPFNPSGLDDATEIYENCIRMLEQADAVVANISPFRGVHMDPGTAFEIGYARAKGKPVYLYSNYLKSLRSRVGAATDAGGYEVEDFGLVENLMITPPGQRVFQDWRHAAWQALRDATGASV